SDAPSQTDFSFPPGFDLYSLSGIAIFLGEPYCHRELPTPARPSSAGAAAAGHLPALLRRRRRRRRLISDSSSSDEADEEWAGRALRGLQGLPKVQRLDECAAASRSMFAASPPPHTRRLSSLHLLTASRSPGGRRHRRCPAAMSLDFGDDDDDEEGEDDSATAEAAADAVASSSVRPVDSEMDSSVVQVFGDNGDDDYGVDENSFSFEMQFDPPASDLGGGQRHCPISPIHLSSGGDASGGSFDCDG
ncbi:hypothetical protein BOX15_Mlig007189g1, partial [Macrostomum lignano]